ncbi:MAG: hypothetical protein ACXWG9_17095, partial [Usitatibacter sp.]
MAKCAVCGKPATHQVTVNEDGRLERVPLCDEHYAEVMGGESSPMESLFQDNDVFGRFFGGRDPFSAFEEAGAGARRRGGGTRPSARGASSRQGAGAAGAPRSRESVDLQSFLSETALELLQNAAENAVRFGKKDVDTEH